MKLKDILIYSARSIKVQRGRAILTILGVMIGITAIVALNGLTGGYYSFISKELNQGMSPQTLTVWRGGGLSEFGGIGIGSTPANFYTENITSLESIPHVDLVMGIMYNQINFGSNITGIVRNYSAAITAIDFKKYAELYPSFSTAGGFGTIPATNNSLVIGHTLYHPFENDSVLVNFGSNLSFSWQDRNGSTYHSSLNVTGVQGKIGSFIFTGGPTDSGIYISLDEAIEIFKTEQLSEIIVHVDTADQGIINNVTASIVKFFSPQGAVTVITASLILSTYNTVLNTVSTLLTAIAAISLIVAGIGIMNIMTVSVIERTREIGILKAIGSTDQSVLSIFLIEALLIGLIGSAIGLVLGYILALGLGGPLLSYMLGTSAFNASFTPVIGPTLIMEAILFGVAVAVVFALYPAIKASRKPPVEALRFE